MTRSGIAALVVGCACGSWGCGVGGGGELLTIDGAAPDVHTDASLGHKDASTEVEASAETSAPLDDGAGDDGAAPAEAGNGADGASGSEGGPTVDATADGGGDSSTPPDARAIDGGVEGSAGDAPAGDALASEAGPVPDGSTTDGDTDAAAGASDGGDGGQCDFSGTWASRLTIDVNWAPQGVVGVILAPGSGTIRQWILTKNTVTGTTMTEVTTVCGIALPDFQGTQVAGAETYGVRFPDGLFDNGSIPTFIATGTLSGLTNGATYTTQPAAALLGVTLANPTTDPWPSTLTQDVDAGDPGVIVDVATGMGYSDVPVDLFKTARADQLTVAIRQVTEITATYSDCDHSSGTVTIPRIPATSSGKYAIDSHILGCDIAAGGGPCNATQVNFVDATQPVFTPSGPTDFTSMRVNDHATCSTVRQAL